MDGTDPFFSGLGDEMGLRELDSGQTVSLHLNFPLKMESVVFYKFFPKNRVTAATCALTNERHLWGVSCIIISRVPARTLLGWKPG